MVKNGGTSSTYKPRSAYRSNPSTKPANNYKPKKTIVKRRYKPSSKANTTAIVRNSARINKLVAQQYGYYQTQTQVSNKPFQVTMRNPAICQLSNLAAGPQGAHFKYPHNYNSYTVTDNNLVDLNNFDIHIDSMMGDDNQLLKYKNVEPNGNRLMWRLCELQFEVSGFLDNTNVDIWIVKERPEKQDPWLARNNRSVPTHLPYLLPQWVGMSGFSAKRLNYKKYNVLHHRRLFFNSRPSYANAVEEVEGTVGSSVQPTVEATTRHVKRTTIKWRPNQVIKQLKPSLHLAEGAVGTGILIDDRGQDTNTHLSGAGSYHWENIDPLDNTWCIITTDDQSTLGSSLTGDAVTVNVIRRNVWQDHIETGS